jgi:anti-sigma factor RsiW
MNTPDWKELNAYADGELAPARALEITCQVDQDEAIGRELHDISRLRASLKTGLRYYRAPKSLLESLPIAVAERAPKPGNNRAGLRRWFAWRPMASALAMVGLFAISTRPGDQLQDEVVASHLRATVSRRLVDVESSDSRALIPLLSSRLDFSPSVADLGLAGTALIGGRIDYVAGRAVAVLVYRVNDHVVDSFVWPTTKGDTDVTETGKRGYRLARWSRDGMAHCVISDVSPENFSAIVQKLRSDTTPRASS